MSYNGYPQIPNGQAPISGYPQAPVSGYPQQAPAPGHQQQQNNQPPPLNYQPSTAYPQPNQQQQPPPQQYPPQQQQQQPQQPQYQQQQSSYQPPPPQQPPQQQYPPQQQSSYQPPPPQQYPPQQQQHPPTPHHPAPHQTPNVVVNTLNGILEVRVLEAEYPKRGFFRGYGNDPYVKVSLGSHHQKTKIFKGQTKATHAQFYETFDFNITGPVSLSFEVLDQDDITPDSLIGLTHVEINMTKFPDNTPHWVTLTKRDRSSPAGRLHISLRMKPPTILVNPTGVYAPHAYGQQVYAAPTTTIYAAATPAVTVYQQPAATVYTPAYPPPVYQQPVVYQQPGVVYQQPGVVYQQPGVVYQQPGVYPGGVYYR